MGIIDRHVSEKVDWSQLSELPIIGVDEISLKKGHRDYVAMITARLSNHQNHILAVLKDRQKETVKEFFLVFPSGYVKRFKWSVPIYMMATSMRLVKFLGDRCGL